MRVSGGVLCVCIMLPATLDVSFLSFLFGPADEKTLLLRLATGRERRRRRRGSEWVIRSKRRKYLRKRINASNVEAGHY